jgi:hypothetical protein
MVQPAEPGRRERRGKLADPDDNGRHVCLRLTAFFFFFFLLVSDHRRRCRSIDIGQLADVLSPA